MRFIPEISLHGSGETITLSNTSEGDYILMQGSDGLGMGPRDISTVALPSGGSLVRHRRREEAEVQLPIFLGGTERGRWDLRRKLERLIRDEVEIRVTRPSGVYRSRFGYYKSGLEGSYGEGEDAAEGQKLVLEFLCPGGLWQGEEQAPNFRLSGLRKRFLSDRATEKGGYESPFLPIVLSSSTVQGEILINIGGDAPVYPTWVIDGPGKDLIIENDKGDSIKVLGEITDQITIVTDPLQQDITSPDNPDGELWENVPTDSVFFPLEPGEQKIKMSMVDAKPNSLVQCFYRENFLAGW